MSHRTRIRKHLIIQIILFLLLIVLDQISKIFLSDILKERGDIIIISDVLNLHYLENTGAAFGIFRDHQWLFFILTAVILGVVIYLFVLLYKALYRYSGSNVRTIRKTISLGYGLAVLCSGAVGNLIDRIVHGYVIDFIHTTFIDFPVFNLADIYVTISCIFIIVYFLFLRGKDEEIKLF